MGLLARVLWQGVCALALGLMLSATLSAQEPPEEPPADEEAEQVFAMPVVFDGEELFVVRGTTALPAEERAALVEERMLRVAEASETLSVIVSVIPDPFGLAIFADGVEVATTTPADAELEQVSIETLAQVQADAIREAILNYRSQRTSAARVESAQQALIWTGVFVVAGFVLLWMRRRLSDRISRVVEGRFAGVEEAAKGLVRGRAVAALVRYLFRLTIVVLLFLLFYYYLSLVMLAFAETRPIAELLLKYVTDPIIEIAKGLVAYFPNLITLIIIAVLTAYAIRGARVFFENMEAGTVVIPEFQEQWIWPTFNILRGALILIALVLAFPYIPGSGSAAFQGVTILVGVMVSLGSNSVVSNLLSGLFVIYRRSTNVGDRIRIGDHVGDVVQIKLMETHLKSIKNELISIPNAQLLNSEVVNYTSMIDGRGLMLHTEVGIGYEEPQEKVEAMLLEAAGRTRGLKTSPPPFVLRKALADFAVTYEINAFTTRGDEIPRLKSELHAHILDVFHANGVQIMTPSYEGDPDAPKIPPEGWDGRLKDASAAE